MERKHGNRVQNLCVVGVGEGRDATHWHGKPNYCLGGEDHGAERLPQQREARVGLSLDPAPLLGGPTEEGTEGVSGAARCSVLAMSK